MDAHTSIIELGIYIKGLRDELGLTLEQLANSSEVSERNITRIEKGKVEAREATLMSILKVLDKTHEEVQKEIGYLRTKFDNGISRVMDLAFKGRFGEAKATANNLSHEYQAYLGCTYYKQRFLLAKGTLMQREETYSQRLSLYVEGLQLTQPTMLLFVEGEFKQLDIAQVKDSILDEVEYYLIKQMATTLGLLNKVEEAAMIFISLLEAFQNEYISTHIKNTLTPIICASLGYYFLEIKGSVAQASSYIEQGIMHSHQTGNHRSLPYLQSLRQSMEKKF